MLLSGKHLAVNGNLDLILSAIKLRLVKTMLLAGIEWVKMKRGGIGKRATAKIHSAKERSCGVVHLKN